MDAVTILRQLWRYRLLVSVGLALALVVGMVLAYKVSLGLPPQFESRQYKVGIASAEVLVDSQRSQVIDLGGGPVRTDVGALSARARLLANIMATSPLKDQIARSAGIEPRALAASAPSIGQSNKPETLNVAPIGPRVTTLTVYYNETLPIITADAQAPTEEAAARISTAAVVELERYLKTVAAQDEVPDARQLVVDPLGPARYGTVRKGPSALFAVIAFLGLFGSWCAGIVVISRFVHRWRQVTEDEKSDDIAVPPSTAPADPPADLPESWRGRAPEPAPARVASRHALELPERPERPVRTNKVA